MQRNQGKFTGGLVLLIAGIVGCAYMWIAISDYLYTYSSPLTDHEIMMLGILIISIITAIIGIVLLATSNTQSYGSQNTYMQHGNSAEPILINTVVCSKCQKTHDSTRKSCPYCGFENEMSAAIHRPMAPPE